MWSHIMWINVICNIRLLSGLMAICCKRLSATLVIAIFPLDYCILNVQINYSSVNPLWPSGGLTARSHYLSQCWPIIKGTLWHSLEGNLITVTPFDSGKCFHLMTSSCSPEVLLNLFCNMYSEIILWKDYYHIPGQWVSSLRFTAYRLRDPVYQNITKVYLESASARGSFAAILSILFMRKKILVKCKLGKGIDMNRCSITINSTCPISHFPWGRTRGIHAVCTLCEHFACKRRPWLLYSDTWCSRSSLTYTVQWVEITRRVRLLVRKDCIALS